jgi:hypothetical protein
MTIVGSAPDGGTVLLAANHGALVDWADAVRTAAAPVTDPGRVGDPLRLSAGPATRRTVAAAADEIHRALAAHVAATRSAPAESERDQP